MSQVFPIPSGQYLFHNALIRNISHDHRDGKQPPASDRFNTRHFEQRLPLKDQFPFAVWAKILWLQR